jgi:hypothetical protein
LLHLTRNLSIHNGSDEISKKDAKLQFISSIGERYVFRISLQIATDIDPVEDFSSDNISVTLFADGNVKHHIDMKKSWTGKQAYIEKGK